MKKRNYSKPSMVVFMLSAEIKLLTQSGGGNIPPTPNSWD